MAPKALLIGTVLFLLPAGLLQADPAVAATSSASAACQLSAFRDVAVSTSQELKQALAVAKPGDRIDLADGTYAGRFSLTQSGTPTARIAVCGGPGAVIDGGGLVGGYSLWVKANYVTIGGITVTDGQKGVMLDGASYDVLDSLVVHRTGDEGIHLRSFSHDDVISGSSVYDTGLRERSFGEGVYVGSAVNNWCSTTGCAPDRSDNNRILNSAFSRNGAEGVDVKEGTSGTQVIGNSFDGQGSGALSWVDIKGNAARVAANNGTNALRDGYLTEIAVDGWGVNNVFTLNRGAVYGPGYGIRVHPGNVVACSNSITDADKGLSNVTCDPSS